MKSFTVVTAFYMVVLALGAADEMTTAFVEAETEGESKQCLMQKNQQVMKTAPVSAQHEQHEAKPQATPVDKERSLAQKEHAVDKKVEHKVEEKVEHKVEEKAHHKEAVEKTTAHKVDVVVSSAKKSRHELKVDSAKGRIASGKSHHHKSKHHKKRDHKNHPKVHKNHHKKHHQSNHKGKETSSLSQADLHVKHEEGSSHKKHLHKKSHHKKSHHKKNQPKQNHKGSLDHKKRHNKNHHDSSSHHKKGHHKKRHASKMLDTASLANLQPSSLAQIQHGLSRDFGKETPNLHEILPEPILALAWQLFEKEEVILDVVQNSVLVNLTYAGVKMSLRMNKADDATTRLGEEGTWFSYDLDTLGDLREKSKMLNMLDIGGNYGIVSIAAFKKYHKHLRVVSVEPIPITFFFLKWNLHINGVPEIEQAQLSDGSQVPGVLALNRGSADTDDQDLHLCFDPSASMNARVCECQRGEKNCVVIPSLTVDSMTNMFGSEPIAMVKMDCEGCEFKSLPALAKPEVAPRIRRLAGELHVPDSSLEELACRWDHGRLLSKCQHSKVDANNYECGVVLTCPN